MYGDLEGTGPYTITMLPVHVIGREHHSDDPQSTTVGKLSRGDVACCLVQRQHDHLAHPDRVTPQLVFSLADHKHVSVLPIF